MRSEIIFRYSSSWWGRYGGLSGVTVTVAADFSDPAKWPYTVERKDWSEGDAWEDEGRTEEVESFRISKAVFDEVKRTVAANSALATCREEIENAVMDGSSESFYFQCDTFTRNISGQSVLGCAFADYERPPHQRSDNYKVRVAYEAIETVLKKAGIDVL
jgi:hypothetical protein